MDERVGSDDAPDALDREPAAEAAGAAGVADEPVALDHDRPVALGQLDRDVRHARAGVGEAVVAVGDRPAAPGADDELAVDERLPRDPAGEEGERAPALAGGRDPLRDQLRERAVHHVRDAVARDAPHRGGPGHEHVGDGAGLRDHGDRPARAAGARNVGRRGGHHGVVDGRLGEGGRAVERAAHLAGSESLKSTPELVAAHRSSVTRDRDVGELDAVGVEVVGEGRRPVGPARDLPAQQELGVVEQLGHQGRSRRSVPYTPCERPAGRDRRCGRRRPGPRGRRAARAGCGRSRAGSRTPPRPARPRRTGASAAAAAPPGRPRCCRRRTIPGRGRRGRRGGRP